MREISDPYKGMKYSDIIAMPENVKVYREARHPLKRVAGTGQATWLAENSRWVV